VFLKQQLSLLKETYSRWSDHEAPRLGASVAFYSILSFAPLLVLVTAIIGFAFGHASAHGALVSEARQLIGDRGAETTEALLKSADKPASGAFASVIAFVTLLFGASGVFAELQAALNIMWDAPKKDSSGLMSMIKQKLFSFGMVLSVGFLLLVSLLLSSALAFVEHSFGEVLPLPTFVAQIANLVFSFMVVTALFALMFKYLPDVPIAWRSVIVGATGTALLFTIGKFLLGIYLGKASVGSTYGAAGSLVAVVVWIYYSAQIFFFGAEYTRLYAEAHGKQNAAAEPVPAPQKSEPQAAVSESASQVPVKGMTPVAAAGAGPNIEPNVPVTARSEPPSPAVKSSHENATALLPASAPQVVARGANGGASAQIRPSRVTKPRLVFAVMIGFVLGRMTFRLAGPRSET